MVQTHPSSGGAAPGGLRGYAGRAASDPGRYSRFVVIMKRVLFFSALALIGAVLAYSLQTRESVRVSTSFARLGRVANDLSMIKPVMHGTDAQGNPFVVTADRAVQDGPSAHKAKLYKVQADITMKNGQWLSANSRGGYLNTDRNLLTLSGDVAVFADSGYEMHTERAQIDLSSGHIAGDSVVTGHGPGGTLRADRFDYQRQSRALHLSGNVQMSFFRHGGKL